MNITMNNFFQNISYFNVSQSEGMGWGLKMNTVGGC